MNVTVPVDALKVVLPSIESEVLYVPCLQLMVVVPVVNVTFDE